MAVHVAVPEVGGSKDRVKGKQAGHVLLVGGSSCSTHSFCSEADESIGFPFTALPPRVLDGLLDFRVRGALVPAGPAGSAGCVPSLPFPGLDVTWAAEPTSLKGSSMTVGRSLWPLLVAAHWDWILRRPRGARLKWWPVRGSGCFLEAGP